MENIFELATDNKEDAVVMKRKSDMLIRVVGTIRQNKWSKLEAAKELGVNPFTVKGLLEGTTDKISEDYLKHCLDTLDEKGYDIWDFPK